MRVFICFLGLVCLANSALKAQNALLQCDGIYQTSNNGVKVIQRVEANNQGEGEPSYFIVDSIPVVCISDFKTVKRTLQKGSRKPSLYIKLKDEVKDKFTNATTLNTRKPLPFIFENKVIAAPIVIFPIESGEIEISGLDEDLINRIVKKFEK
jgi:preprotein translocase subunit SecD